MPAREQTLLYILSACFRPVVTAPSAGTNRYVCPVALRYDRCKCAAQVLSNVTRCLPRSNSKSEDLADSLLHAMGGFMGAALFDLAQHVQ